MGMGRARTNYRVTYWWPGTTDGGQVLFGSEEEAFWFVMRLGKEYCAAVHRVNTRMLYTYSSGVRVWDAEDEHDGDGGTK